MATDLLRDALAREKQRADLYGSLLKIFMAPILLMVSLPFTFWRAWVLTRIWLWYGVRYTDWGRLPFGLALGICFIATLLSHSSYAKKGESKDTDWMVLFIGAFILPLMTLFVAWFGLFFL